MRIFLERVAGERPARSAAQALALLTANLNAVEDERNPTLWKSDGRMYPPQEDNFRGVPNHPSLRRCRSRGHDTYFGENGSIRIETLAGKILLDKAGADGRKPHDLNASPRGEGNPLV